MLPAFLFLAAPICALQSDELAAILTQRNWHCRDGTHEEHQHVAELDERSGGPPVKPDPWGDEVRDVS